MTTKALKVGGQRSARNGGNLTIYGSAHNLLSISFDIRGAGRSISFCRLCCVEATFSGRGDLCRPYRVACHGGRGGDLDDRALDLDDPLEGLDDLDACHADLAPVLLDQRRTVCRVAVLADLHEDHGDLLGCLFCPP